MHLKRSLTASLGASDLCAHVLFHRLYRVLRVQIQTSLWILMPIPILSLENHTTNGKLRMGDHVRVLLVMYIAHWFVPARIVYTINSEGLFISSTHEAGENKHLLNFTVDGTIFIECVLASISTTKKQLFCLLAPVVVFSRASLDLANRVRMNFIGKPTDLYFHWGNTLHGEHSCPQVSMREFIRCK